MLLKPTKIDTLHENTTILVDLDNTLVFTNHANNQAYLDAIAYFLPQAIIPRKKRITASFIEQYLSDVDKKIINKIIEHKHQHYSDYLSLTELNQPLYQWLLEHQNFSIYLVSNANQRRAEKILTHYQISDLFDKKHYRKGKENKYLDFINSSQNNIVIDDDIKQLKPLTKLDNIQTFQIIKD